jgi:hypothetical protein
MTTFSGTAKRVRTRWPSWAGCALASALLTLSHESAAENSTAIMVEGVSNYSACGYQSIDGAQEASGFLTGMTVSGSWWTGRTPYYDSSVYDTDFLDPDYSHVAQDDDTSNSDVFGTAIGFFMAHGICNDATTQACTTSSQCGSGYCPGLPPTSNSSACIQHYTRRLITCSPIESKHGDNVSYAPGNTKWGEDANSGNWAGAGTNGDLNVVFLINSCGVRPAYVYDMSSVFAGVQLVNMIMPTGNIAMSGGEADTQTWSQRGSSLATLATMNPYGSIKDAWDATLDSAPNQTTTDGCPNLDNNYAYGGGHAIHGCGAHVSIAMDSTDAGAQADINMNWDYARRNYSSGTNSYYWWAHCNYDCATYGFTK